MQTMTVEGGEKYTVYVRIDRREHEDGTGAVMTTVTPIRNQPELGGLADTISRIITATNHGWNRLDADGKSE